MEGYQGTNGDDTSLGAIELTCASTSGSDTNTRTITSKQGAWGNWRGLHSCSGGFFNGGRLRSVPHLGSREDDTGATDLKMHCGGDDQWYRGGGEGKEVSWGDWLTAAECPDKYAICGLRTLVVDPLGSSEDDTTLSGVQFACCSL